MKASIAPPGPREVTLTMTDREAADLYSVLSHILKYSGDGFDKRAGSNSLISFNVTRTIREILWPDPRGDF
jgi:hypothetical protein